MLRILLPVTLALAVTCASAQRAERASRPPDADLVSSSELFYSESGGFAGRVHSARLVATGGTISVEYRPPETRAPATPLTGTLPPDRYLALWRAVDALQPWSRADVPPPAGAADMIVRELRIRVGTRSKTVSWVEGAAMGDLAAAGSRILAAARDHTLNR